MTRLKSLLQLFITMLKIGLFTFGGGYAMIALLQSELVSKKGWIGKDEFADMVAIAESTPGPIAINCATYVGYKREKFLGAMLSTLGVCIPSFVIIYLISLFFDTFISLNIVACAFKGVQVCVSYLVLSAGLKMIKGLKLSPFNVVMVSMTAVALIALTWFSVNFSSVFFILIGVAVGLCAYVIAKIKGDKK